MATTFQPVSIPTLYRGVQFRSRLEANVACFMDKLGWGWEYEPQSFLLENGLHYRPDFYVADDRLTGMRTGPLWIEVRGYDTESGRAKIAGFQKHLFAAENEANFLVLNTATREIYLFCYLGNNKAGLYTSVYHGRNQALLWQCETCKKWLLYPSEVSLCCWSCAAMSLSAHVQLLWARRDQNLMVGNSTIEEWNCAK